MRILTQRCDYCLQEETDTLSCNSEYPKKVFRLGIQDACLYCDNKAQQLLEAGRDHDIN